MRKLVPNIRQTADVNCTEDSIGRQTPLQHVFIQFLELYSKSNKTVEMEDDVQTQIMISNNLKNIKYNNCAVHTAPFIPNVLNMLFMCFLMFIHLDKYIYLIWFYFEGYFFLYWKTICFLTTFNTSKNAKMSSSRSTVFMGLTLSIVTF